MGAGALLSAELSPTFVHALTNPDPNLNGPGVVFVRLRNNVSPAAGLADMNRIAALANAVFAKDRNTFGDTVNVIGVQRPAEIVNYQSTGATPVVLAIGLAVGAVLALRADVDRLRSTTATRPRSLEDTRFHGSPIGQAAIAWQASTIATVSAVIGIPIGIVAGRELWDLFARRHQRRTAADGTHLVDTCRRRGVPPRQPRRRHSCPYSGSYPGSARPPI